MCRYRLVPSPCQEAILRAHCGHARFVSRAVPAARSYRVSRDRAGRGHVAFAALPDPVPAPGTGEVVGVDRGVAVAAALSSGELLRIPRPSPARQRRLRRLQRKLARARPGSNRRARAKRAIARLKARDRDARRDWAEKTSADLARRFDLIRVEDLKIGSMTRSARGTTAEPGRDVAAKAGLNREPQFVLLQCEAGIPCAQAGEDAKAPQFCPTARPRRRRTPGML